jgi:hypothetical protein
MTETWMRVVVYHAAPGAEPEAAAKYLRSSTSDTLALLEKQPGFRLGYWGHNPVSGEMSAVTYWETLDAIHRADPMLDKLHERRAEHGIRVISARNIRLFAVPVGPVWQQPPGLSDQDS